MLVSKSSLEPLSESLQRACRTPFDTNCDCRMGNGISSFLLWNCVPPTQPPTPPRTIDQDELKIYGTRDG